MPTQIRLLSYNVRSLRDDAEAVATVIRSCDADVVCIQEAPRFFRWRHKCARLARESGMVIATGGRPAAAMLVLTSLRLRVVSTRDVLLSKDPRLHQRGIALVIFELDGRRFAAGSIHLDLEAQARRRHVDEIFACLQGIEEPVVLAGDINEEPGAPAWQAMAARLPDAYVVAPAGGEFTYSAQDPVRRIDGIFVDPRITVRGCGVPDVLGIAQASDHRPVLATLQLD